MLKKLDILVIKAFVGPFIATFFITVLVLLMQFFWLWVDDFVGKGISTKVLFEFIWYQSAVLVPLALPLAILLSSIMTFGNMGESYELVAIRAAGISLLRFMRPLLFVTILICGIAFAFSNNIIPVATLKSRTLLYDVVQANPSFDLKEGVFYDRIPQFAIKIGKKEKDSLIKDVIIYEQTTTTQDNFIIASNGVMRSSENRRFIEFILFNGWRYEERGSAPNTEYIRLGFKEYKRMFDISSLGFQQRTADSVNKNNARMLSMRQLSVAIDSMQKDRNKLGNKVKAEVMNSFVFRRYMDSSWKFTPEKVKAKTFSQLVPDSIKSYVHERIVGKLNNAVVSNQVVIDQDVPQRKSLWGYKVEWHKKLMLSFSCIVMFLIGAPLGSIIRKGGLGSPLIFAIIFFMLFYFSSTGGEKAAREGSLSPFTGMWLSSFILLPIGFFLIYNAMRDSQLFNKEWYYRFWRKLRRRKA
ncbi:MAG TPA: LptF/LptG family permease [Flavisolibacter sp.]|nr:LptF/LptG family permease [Flavisolibacter sp.]